MMAKPDFTGFKCYEILSQRDKLQCLGILCLDNREDVDSLETQIIGLRNFLKEARVALANHGVSFEVSAPLGKLAYLLGRVLDGANVPLFQPCSRPHRPPQSYPYWPIMGMACAIIEQASQPESRERVVQVLQQGVKLRFRSGKGLKSDVADAVAEILLKYDGLDWPMPAKDRIEGKSKKDKPQGKRLYDLYMKLQAADHKVPKKTYQRFFDQEGREEGLTYYRAAKSLDPVEILRRIRYLTTTWGLSPPRMAPSEQSALQEKFLKHDRERFEARRNLPEVAHRQYYRSSRPGAK